MCRLKKMYSVNIKDKSGFVQHVVVHSDAVVPPPNDDSRTNLTFEDVIKETAVCVPGDMIVVIDHAGGSSSTGAAHHRVGSNEHVFVGSVFSIERHGGRRTASWYSEIMLVAPLIGVDGSPCRAFEAAVVLTDHQERVNLIRLVPKGCAVDMHEEDYDPPASPMASSAAAESIMSPRKTRMAQAFHNRNADHA